MFIDLECPQCEKVSIDVWIARRDDRPKCECGATMEKRIAAPGFVVKGYNAKNGYSDD